MDKELIRKCITYLSIIESMEEIDKKWYQKVFRNHEDWEQGLPQTIEDLKQLQEIMKNAVVIQQQQQQQEKKVIG